MSASGCVVANISVLQQTCDGMCQPRTHTLKFSTLKHTHTRTGTSTHLYKFPLFNTNNHFVIHTATCCNLLQQTAPIDTESSVFNQRHVSFVATTSSLATWQWWIGRQTTLHHHHTALSWASLSILLQCATVCCSVLQCVAVRCSVLDYFEVCCSVLQCVAVCYSMLKCVAVCCSVA